MGTTSSSEARVLNGEGEESSSNTMMNSSGGVTGALSSLWSTSSDKDDTCVQWGLVSIHYVPSNQ